MEFQQLWPEPRVTEVEAYLDALALTERSPSGRPYALVNFVSSIDGRATVGGRSGGLGDDGDKAMFGGLRRQVDAVLVGTGTLAAERYGRVIRDPAARERRRGRGLRPEPLTCIVTRSGSVPLDIPLFAEPEAEVVIFTAAQIDTAACAAQVTAVRLDADELSFAAALERLHADYGIRALLCEGGPGVFGALLREDLVDALFLTLARKLAGGGDEPAITRGPALPEPATMALAGVLERAGTLFLRYERPA
jgi:5-amino-6-(5-phosphoribosylamino)uracil reductase